eukprot:700302-Rhodomonas_salina.3
MGGTGKKLRLVPGKAKLASEGGCPCGRAPRAEGPETLAHTAPRVGSIPLDAAADRPRIDSSICEICKILELVSIGDAASPLAIDGGTPGEAGCCIEKDGDDEEETEACGTRAPCGAATLLPCCVDEKLAKPLVAGNWRTLKLENVRELRLPPAPFGHG